jgi:hypothetical protein
MRLTEVSVTMGECQKSFLSLWSYSNSYTDEDLRGGKGSGKELCDVLVVFGDDVIIFSDKHINFQSEKPIDIAWPRWYKRAVAGSVSQLYGAMNWLIRFPERVFLDAKCTRRLPVQVPPPERARYHLVAVTRGTLDASKEYFGGGLGTPMIDNTIKGDKHYEHPFQVGIPTPEKHFVHVIDEVSLKLIHDELDTVADLTTYLAAREEFLNNESTSIAASGEEQLLAAYLMHMDGESHSFLPSELKNQKEQPSHISFDDSFFGSLKSHPNYIAKKQADRISYEWDRLVEKLIRLGDPELVRPGLAQSSSHIEEALRIIAGQTRFQRRILSHALRSVFQLALERPTARRARIAASEDDTKPVYIFVILPKFMNESYDDYRKRRAYYLEAYCRCAKLKFPSVHTFVGLGFDHPIKDYEGSSEDLVVVEIEDLSLEEKIQLEEIRDGLGILTNDMTMEPYHAVEYPRLYPELVRNAGYTIPFKRSTANEQARLKKTRRKMAKSSRKRNAKK